MKKKKFLTDKDSFIMIEVAEELLEFVNENNREVWRDTKRDKRVIVISFDSLYESKGIEYASNTRNPEEELMHEIRCNKMAELIHSIFKVLSEKETELIILRFYRGLKISEIAERQNCVKSAVSQHLDRIYRKLRKVLEKVDIEDFFVD